MSDQNEKTAQWLACGTTIRLCTNAEEEKWNQNLAVPGVAVVYDDRDGLHPWPAPKCQRDVEILWVNFATLNIMVDRVVMTEEDMAIYNRSIVPVRVTIHD